MKNKNVFMAVNILVLSHSFIFTSCSHYSRAGEDPVIISLVSLSVLLLFSSAIIFIIRKGETDNTNQEEIKNQTTEKENPKEKEKNELIQQLGGEVTSKYENNEGNIYFMTSDIYQKFYIRGFAFNFELEKSIYLKKIFDYKELLAVSIITDTYKESSSEETTNNSDMIKRAVVGGILGGKVGAVVGASTAKKQIEYNEKVVSYRNLVLKLDDEEYSDVKLYLGQQHLDDIYMILKKIVKNNEQSKLKVETPEKTTSEKSNTQFSIADEILKLNQLRKDGVLTDEEFQQQKEFLLRK